MAQDLESIFQELGISQYLDIFLEQGFDTWDTILDITESDLLVAHVDDVYQRLTHDSVTHLVSSWATDV